MSQAWNSIDQTPTGRPETDRKLKLTGDNAFLYMGFNPPRNGPFIHPSDPRYKDPGERYQLSAFWPMLLLLLPLAISPHATRKRSSSTPRYSRNAAAKLTPDGPCLSSHARVYIFLLCTQSFPRAVTSGFNHPGSFASNRSSGKSGVTAAHFKASGAQFKELSRRTPTSP